MRSIPFSSAGARLAGDADGGTDVSSAFSPSGGEDHIPIDPALAGFDPGFQILPHANGFGVDELGNVSAAEEKQVSSPLSDPDSAYRHSSILEGPQGDPFLFSHPIQLAEASPPPPPPKSGRRGRRVRCQFCRSDSLNAAGEPEPMLTCSGCKKTGHPSCMKWEGEIDRARSWSWKCIECKECEICREKGDDDRILFCDACDRGWHMDCLDPPLSKAPRGKWACPACDDVQFPEPANSSHASSSRQTSVFSERPVSPSPQSKKANGRSNNRRAGSSRKSPKKSRTDNRKGKQREEVADSTEEDSVALDLDDDDSDSSTAPDSENGEEDIHFGAVKTKPRNRASSARQRKRKNRPSKSQAQRRVHIIATKDPPPDEDPPPQASRKAVKLRLKLPARQNGKEGEPTSPKKDPLDELLSKEEADVTQTTILPPDKSRFEKAKVLAENKIFNLHPNPPQERASFPNFANTSLRSTRHNRSPLPSVPPTQSVTPSSPAPRGSKELRIRTIRFGLYDIDTWYDAPFPEEYSHLPEGRLWYCENCLKYMKSKFMAGRHRTKCKARHPPGDEIYRDGIVSIFEVDGRKHKTYCQNLCLLSKMFLDHKSLFYDVEPFLFYVITEVDDVAARFVGYFSKEKASLKDYNVSCIMTLPIRQRQGWGNLLVDFSYLLSLRERRPGSPEKPLSGLGEITYKRYWKLAILRYLAVAEQPVTLERIQEHTAMTLEDIYNTLLANQMIAVKEERSSTPSFAAFGRSNRPRKKLKRPAPSTPRFESDDSPPAFVPPSSYMIRYNLDDVRSFLADYESKGNLRLNPEALRWTPYLLTRTPKPHLLETGASMTVRDAGGSAHHGWQASDGVEQPPNVLGARGASTAPASPYPMKTGSELGVWSVNDGTETPRRILRTRASRDVHTSSPHFSISRSPTPMKRVLRSTKKSSEPQPVPPSPRPQRQPPRKRLRIDSSPENETDETTPVGMEPPTPSTPLATGHPEVNGVYDSLALVASVASTFAAKPIPSSSGLERGLSHDHASFPLASSVGTGITEDTIVMENGAGPYDFHSVKQELLEDGSLPLYAQTNGGPYHHLSQQWQPAANDNWDLLDEDAEGEEDADGEYALDMHGM